MRFEYSDEISPSGLIIPILISGLGISLKRTAHAIIDTGADISTIPQDLIQFLGLQPRGYRHYRFPGEKHIRVAPTYYVSLKIPDAPLLNTAVIATDDEYALLGRDILNQFVLHADGPKGKFDLYFNSSS